MSGRSAPLPRCSGFSLVELMVVLVIAAITLAIALPSFGMLIERNRLVAQTNELTAALAFARAEAIRRNREIRVCPTNSTDDDCETGGSWARGWLIWSDENDSGGLNPATEILRVGLVAQGITMTPTAGGTAISDLRFGPRGTRVLPAVDTVIQVSSTECSAGKELIRNLTINLVGSVAMATAVCP